MLIERYFEALQSKMAEIAADPEPIRQAARLCADSIAAGGAIHIYDSGHMVSSELIHRAGGLAAFSALTFNLNVNSQVRTRADQALPPDNTLSFGYISHVFETNQLRPGDVLIVGSVSGKTPNVIELAIQGRQHGLKVIALTAVAYSSRLVSEHPSGLHLYEAGDMVLDNHAPYGDAMLQVDGLDYDVCPASGLGAATVLWALSAAIIDEMLARGLKPTVFPSVNRPEGRQELEAVYAEALRKGY